MTSTQETSTGPRDTHHEIIVNGRPKKWTSDTISYSELLNLAFNNNPPTGDGIVITVTYSRGVDRAQGSLLPDKSVPVKSGMVFDATPTTRS